MQEILTFDRAKAVLRRYIPTAQAQPRPYSLDRMQEMMELLGNPQDKVSVIHVAGTSGKSSTCYYIASALTAAGYNVGLTVSPHVAEINERVQIDMQPLPEVEFCKALGDFIERIEQAGIKPSYFELLVAFAYDEFARRNVDYAVVETGLGGLLDGTNVVTRSDKVCVITDIGLDHTEILGDTLPEIAAQKAGIIHAHNTVITHRQDPAVISVIRHAAEAKSAALHLVEPSKIIAPHTMPLFQQHNWQLAREAVDFVLQRDHNRSLNETEVSAAQNTRIPARMESIAKDGKTVVLDGAHNEQKVRSLLASMRDRFTGQEIAVLLSLSKGYQLEKVLGLVTGIASHIIITEFTAGQDSPRRAVPPESIARVCHELGFDSLEIIREPQAGLSQLLARPEPVLLLTGSFYLLYELRPELIS